jgi:hypothetical protein
MGFLLSTLLAATIATTAPHPAPYGPQRPYEPDVAGPVNIETGDITVTKGSGRGVTVSFDTARRTESGEKPAAPRQFVFLFDNSIRFNTELFPVCQRNTIEQHGVGGCPAGSKVGSGRAEFYPAGAAEVAVFNTRFGNGMRGVLITIPATGTILDNTFEPVVYPYQKDYTWGSHEIIPPDSTPPQYRGVTSAFQVSFGAEYRGRSFVESSAPAGRTLRFGVWGEYVTGQVLLGEQTVSRP